ncbi:MAG: hypothetical protein GX606_06465 [Elusimicrobia bacterium]|nr:hypothetical protein [Elusimicrobiota bacterium]
MDQDHNEKNSSGSGEGECAGLLQKMQQQINALERKIDVLIALSQERPSRERSFEKPFRSFDRSESRGGFHKRHEYGEGPREHGFSARPGFQKRRDRDEGPRGFGAPREGYGQDRGGAPGRGDRPFKKPYGGGKSFGGGKPFGGGKKRFGPRPR